MDHEKLANGFRLTKVNERLSVYEKAGGQTFGADAFLLAAYAAADPANDAADLGCGTGICALLLADRKKAKHIYAVDIQSELIDAAKVNISMNSLDGRITAVCSDVRFLTVGSFPHPVSTVIANPPYIPVGAGRIPPDVSRAAARHELNGGIFEFCSVASRILAPHGRFFCVFRPERLTDLISALNTSGLAPRTVTFVHHNAECEPAMILTEAVKGRAALRVTRPLFLYREKNVMSDDAAKIYDNCSFEDFLNE